MVFGEGDDPGFFLWGEDATPEGWVDGVGNLDVEAEFDVLSDGEGAPVMRVAEVELWWVGSLEEWLAIGAAAEEDLCRGAVEVSGEDLAHAGVGANPLRSMERGAETLGPA